jgi:cation transporter-like permease
VQSATGEWQVFFCCRPTLSVIGSVHGSYHYNTYRSKVGAFSTVVLVAIMAYYITSISLSWVQSVPALQVENTRDLNPSFKTQPRPFAIRCGDTLTEHRKA